MHWETGFVRRASGVRRTCLVRRGEYLKTCFDLFDRRVGVSVHVVEVALTERVRDRADDISRHAESHLLGTYLVGADGREPGPPAHLRPHVHNTQVSVDRRETAGGRHSALIVNAASLISWILPISLQTSTPPASIIKTPSH